MTMIPENTLTAIAENIRSLELDPILHARVTIAVFNPLLADHPAKSKTVLDSNIAAKLAKALPKRAEAKPKKKKISGSNGPAPSTVAAMEFLKQELVNGPKLVTDVETVAEKRGISLNALGRARTALRIMPQRVNSGGHGNAVQIALPAS